MVRLHEAYEEQLCKVFLTTSANFKISEKKLQVVRLCIAGDASFRDKKNKWIFVF